MSRDALRPFLTATWLSGLLLAGWAQYAIRQNPNDDVATLVFLLATLATALALGWSSGDDSGSVLPPARQDAEQRHQHRGAALAIAGALGVAAGSAMLGLDWRSWFFPGWLVLLAGIVVLSVGLRRYDGRNPAGRRWTRTEVALLLLLLALGAFLRFHRYSDFPDAFTTHAIEEQQTGLGGYRILLGARPWEFLLDHYLAAAALALSDAPTFLTLRVPFTAASALTILPVHLLLRQLVATPAALAGTFLFSISSWNIIYSRCAHNIFLTNFFVVAVLALLVHFGRTRRLGGLPWVGLFSGYTLYTYAGYRGTPLFALVFLGGLATADLYRLLRASTNERRDWAWQRLLRDAAGIAVVAALIAAVALPMIVLLRADTANPSYYFEAWSRSLANKEYYTDDLSAFVAQRLERIRGAARIFLHAGDGSLTFNDPGRPMLDPFTGTAFVAGLWLALCWPWRKYNAFLVWMFVVLMLIGTVMVQNLDVRRLQGITVFVVLFAALFFDRLWAAVRQWRQRVVRPVAMALAAVCAVAALSWNYDLYFHDMAGNPRVREAFKNHYTTLIRYSRERGARDGTVRPILLISLLRRFYDPGYYYASHYAWLRQGLMEGRDLDDLSELLPPAEPKSAGAAVSVVIQDPYERQAVGELLTALYPGTSCAEFVDPDSPRTALTVCDMQEAPRARPFRATLRARYWTSGAAAGRSGLPFLDRPEPFIAYATVPATCYAGEPGSHCLVEWEGTLEVPVTGRYQFLTATRGGSTLSVWIDGKPVGSEEMELAAGPHAVRAQAKLPREIEAGVRLLWLRDGHTELVPFYALGSRQ